MGGVDPVLCPGRRLPPSTPRDRPPSLHHLRHRLGPALFGASQVLCSRPTPRLFRGSFAHPGFLPWPGIAVATAGETRSPRFRRDPFVRGVALDPGGTTPLA